MKGMPCAAGVGACAAPGHFACTPDEAAVACDAVAGMPQAEQCNALDDDCDGHTDEGFGVGMPCDGADADACSEGVVACDGAGGTTCTDTTGDNVDLRSGSAGSGDVACDDDTCGLQSQFAGAHVSGANLQWLIVDGFGLTGNGAYTLTYSIQ